jgi:glycosyltransferase involved in cell wall biosynthesis
MSLLGLIPEPPFATKSWSGSSAHFFGAMQKAGLLAGAEEVRLGQAAEFMYKVRALGWPMSRWKEQYHASTARFAGLTRVAGAQIRRATRATGVIQVGAWFSSPAVTDLPCFSYHDGNAALWYRFYGRGLLSPARIERHLAWERSNYARMKAIFVMSDWLGRSFVEDFGVPAERVHVVGAGINFDQLPVPAPRDHATPRFLFVGRDFARKGGTHLLAAFRQVRAAVPNAELIVVGPDARAPQPGVTWAGFLRKSDPGDLAKLKSYFDTSTIMILPSIYEPFGISLLEGMANNMACVAVDRCAMPEIVTHGETGLIARAEDPASLAERMIELARDPARVRDMGLKGRRRVEEHYTWPAVVGKIRRVITRAP